MASLCVFLGLVTLSHAYVNIAREKPTYQLHPFIKNDHRFDASNAVDGLTSDLSAFGGECVVSKDNHRTAIWWVNLTSIHSIHHITIFYRTDNTNYGPYNDRFLGFSLFVSNTTNTSDGFLCFKDRGVYNKSTIPVIFNTNCSVHGQYVIYYNERLTGVPYPKDYSPYAYNELCEVEVFGCSSTGFYTVNCSVPCPDLNCQYCHIETGTCQGCKPGYQGHRCELDCDENMFGERCSSSCGHCLGSEQCHHINGTCMNGCASGYEGELCTKVCRTGYFGQDCAMKCRDTCTGCNNINGLCDKGCHPGWKGNYCDEHCDERMFGERCSSSCGHCLGSEQCHHINGTCMNGCASGYESDFCTKECDANYFGINCREMCNVTCKGCNSTTGICDTGCKPGWRDVYCHKACSVGNFGINCASVCGHCSNEKECHHVTGNCVEGCLPGYKIPTCIAACDGNLYGENCSMRCGHCLKSEQCHHINGTCLEGCDSGYQGSICMEECKDNYFGPNCNEICNSTCRSCNKTTGICDVGCHPGWKGLFCHEPCNQRKYGENCSLLCGHCLGAKQCHHINGTCTGGCASGYQGLYCTKECDDKHFGPNCQEMCNTTCKSCNKSTGICDFGCHPGWRGLFCQEECIAGFYGENCNNKCGHCLNETACHHVTGMCDVECDPGYQTPYCTEECSEGNYGMKCNKLCGSCSNISHCSHVDGTCRTGCSPGYRHNICKEVCEEGRFGQDCALKCNTTCQGCNNVNGVCDTGCKTGWKGVYCHEVLPQTSNEGALIGGSIGVLVILIAVCLIVLTIIRRRNQKSQLKNADSHFNGNMISDTEMVVKSNSKDSEMNDSNDSVKLVQPTDSNKEEWNENPFGDNDIYMNEQFTPNIPVDQLDSFIAEKRSKGNEGFKKEYAGLPSGEIRCCDAGKKQENISKNRFKTTFPYDHSRVKLHVDDESSSDYINANYIDGHNRQKEYIAAQGPKANTLADFWRMIWQENVATIVMVTNLKEGEKVKCTQYWPERNKPFSAGPVMVKLIEEKEYAFYIERKMSVSNKQLKKTRVIYQHHYTAWPDHGTPESLCLLTFHNHVISKTNNNTNVPTVVHCSAGVGRTGTYIALDALYHMGKQTGTVNVVEFVKKMRGNRVSMVQTFEQYTTIYLALNNIFKAPIKMDNSTDVFFKAEKAIQGAQATRKEFQLLLNVRPAYTGVDYKIAKQNSAKNCADTILPLDKYSLFLSSSVSNRGNYINAIVVPSLTNGRRFIVTKYPIPDGAVDFLRLLDDHESDTVICMDPVQDIDSIRSWLPDASSSTVVTPFTVHCQSKSKTDVTCHLIDIVQEKNEDESHSVVVVEPRAKIGPIETSQDTSHLRSLVSAALLSETENPITVVCSDGASLCGVFLAVHNAIQQLGIDGWVDVFTTVRHLQVRRPEFCANFNEYQMVFKALYDHIQSTTETIYSNQ
nr:uncharacterized protein LOC105334720 isoform X5 [Crassostrea gigas]